MCGISGIWQRQGEAVSMQMATRFNDALTHRGPDHGAIEPVLPELTLGHRRLSILDTSTAGHQPMWDHTRRYCMVFNGEVFNFLELRAELESQGEQFNSDTDSEVILAAYRCWGKAAFHRFNGMWAIAIWDVQEQELMLSRDRFGIKPLYFHSSDQLFAFASETSAFSALQGFEKEISWKKWKALDRDVYALEGIGETMYKGIAQLLPGHMMFIQANGETQQERWYDIRNANPEIPQTYEARRLRFLELFEDACRIRMRSDVPMATALSGGVDSTAVYSMVHRLMSGDKEVERSPQDWQKAFIATFPGTSRDERAWAERALQHSNGQGVFIEQDYNDLLPRLLETSKAHDGITGTPVIALSDVYRSMHSHGVTVSLDGHGVDEMLYGYKSMVYDGMGHHMWHGSMEDALASIEVYVDLLPQEERRAKRASLMSQLDKVQHTRRQVKFRLKQQMKQLVGTRSKAPRLIQSASDEPYDFSGYSPLDQSVYEEFFLRTLPALLHNFDLAAMLSSVEIRMPFMDYRLVEYAFALEYGDKVGGGYTKRILRDAMQGIMPEENRVRTYKVGLGAPIKDWFAGPLHEWIGDSLATQSIAKSPLADLADLQGLRQRWSSKNWDDATAAQDWRLLNTVILIGS